MNSSISSILKISGPDATKFLQGQITIDVEKLEPNNPHLAAYCSQKGRVIAVFFIEKQTEIQYQIYLPGDNLETFITKLKKYAIFSKVEIQNLTLDDIKLPSLLTEALQKPGIPIIYKTTSEKFLPHMLNLDKLGALDFKKGCYLGQEIIARTEYRGTIKRNMKEVKVTNSAQDFTPGSSIVLDDGSKGIVVYATADTLFAII